MREKIDEIIIVGGGDSGLLTALCVQKLNPKVDISVIDDFQKETPQVGKSTYHKIYGFLHDFLDISEERFIRKVKPVWKCSVFFRDWCGCYPFHYPFDLSQKFPNRTMPNSFQAYVSLYENKYKENMTINEKIVEQEKSPWHVNPKTGKYSISGPIAYHLDTRRFNAFLKEICRERGILLIDDEITGRDISDGRVDHIRSNSNVYESDLYIDASGFNRILKEQMGDTFNDFDFPLDSAFTTKVDRRLANIVPATVVESGHNGWFWQIDTFDDRDLGYVFSSEFTSDEKALAEFLDYCPDNVSENDVTKFEFTSGYYERPWTNNCLAIGNAGGFVEPLESTALTFNTEVAIRLSMLLSASGQMVHKGLRETFNEWFRWGWDGIYDFIATHYKFAPGDTEFWKTMQAMDVTPRVERIESEFNRNGFETNVASPTEMGTTTKPLLTFQLESFYILMRNMGCTSEFYESNEFHVRDGFNRTIERSLDQKSQRIERDYITTEEYYKGVLGQS